MDPGSDPHLSRDFIGGRFHCDGDPLALPARQEDPVLDRWTVSAVVNTIRGTDHNPAVLWVSHRTEVLAESDVTIDIKDGKIVLVETKPE